MGYKVAFVGTGRIAYSFANQILSSGGEICGISNRSDKNANLFSQKFNLKLDNLAIKNLPHSSNVFVLSVPDSSVQAVAEQLSLNNMDFNGKIVIHLSGAIDASVLDSVAQKGAVTGAVHTPQTFPDNTIISLNNSFASIETSNQSNFTEIKKFTDFLGLRTFEIKAEFKPLYHLTAVFVSNFLNSNIFVAKEFFTLTGNDDSNFYEIYKNIITTTAENIINKKLPGSISGPLKRKEVETINSHISNILNSEIKPEINKLLYLNSYLTQSAILIKALSENGDDEFSSIQKLINEKLILVCGLLQDELKREKNNGL